MDNAVIKKAYRGASVSYYIGIVMLVLGLLFAVWSVVDFSQAKGNIRSMDSIIASREKAKTGKISYVEVYDFFQFASKGDEKLYYIGYNDDSYYILEMTPKAYAYAVRQYNANAGSLVKIPGYTSSIPSEARKYAIEGLNEKAEQSVVTSSTFDDVFGDVMLTVEEESKLMGLGGLFDISGGLLIIGGVLLLGGLLTFFIGRNSRKSFSQAFDADGLQNSPIMDEINSPTAIWLKEIKVYLTDNHLVNVAGRLDAIDYKDIFWMYVTRHRTNGMQDYNFINVITKDGRTYNIGNGQTFSKKNRAITEELHDEVFAKAKEKNPEIRVGYDEMNLDAYKNLQQTIKENKKTGVQ